MFKHVFLLGLMKSIIIVKIYSQIIFSNNVNKEVFKKNTEISNTKEIMVNEAISDTTKLTNMDSLTTIVTKKIKQKNNFLSEIPSIYPLFLKNGIIISANFKYRVHPVTGKLKFHNGIDLPAQKNENIYATADGVVVKIYTNPNTGYGYAIKLKHKYSYETIYGHMAKKPKFKIGDTIERGQIIGNVGSTGLSTGNHLHYTIYYKNKAINPLSYCKLLAN